MNIEQTAANLLQVAKDVGSGKVPPYQSNEYFTAGAFDLIIFNGEDKVEKFELLSYLCNQYDLVKNDAEHLKGYLYLLIQLTYATRTTERPQGMQRILDEKPKHHGRVAHMVQRRKLTIGLIQKFINYTAALRCSGSETIGTVTKKAFVKDAGFGDCPMMIEYEFQYEDGKTFTGNHTGTESSYWNVATNDIILVRFLEKDPNINAPLDSLGIIQKHEKG